MASAPSPQACAALSLATSLGLSLRADWLEAARAGGGNSSSSPVTAEALVSLVLNADLNSAGAGESLPGDLEVREARSEERERAKRRKEEKVSEGEFSSSSSSLLSARGNRKKTQPRPPSTTGKKKVPPRPRPPRTQDPSGRRNVQRCCLGETPVSFLQLKRKQERERRRVSSFIGSLMKKEKTHNPKRPFSKPGIPTTTTTATPARLSVGGCSSFC